MRIDTRLFHSILARRFFVLFILSALMPIVILSSIAYWKVSNELENQGRYRLYHAANSVRLSVSERLQFLEAELSMVMHLVMPAGFQPTVSAAGGRLQQLFDGLVVVSGDGKISTIFGEVPALPELTGDQLDHMEQGRGLVLSFGGASGEPPILAMMRVLDPSNPGVGVVAGVISPDYLWGIAGANVIPYGIEMCAYNEERRLIHGSYDGCGEISPLVIAETVGTHRGDLDIEINGEEFMAAFRNQFLTPQFLVETWSFVLIHSEVEVLNLRETLFDPEDFQLVFPLVVLVCFWVVLLLSSLAIRQSLVPLDRLTEGTQRIAERDFSTRVEVDSGDEFEDLAGAFNIMSDRLQRQFRALATNAEIHRAILSTIDTTTIVETATAGALDTIGCDLVCVGVRGAGDSAEAALFSAAKDNVEVVNGLTSQMSASDIDRLSSGTKSVVLSDDGGDSALLASLPASADSTVVAFPVMLESRLAAALCICRIGGKDFSVEELDHGRQLADQVAVALSNSNLIEELKALTWGTLEALARAIDAKSPWTAGHSGRVTATSLKIARALGRSPRELDVLNRGALLHDIGKLGISAQVLDKPGRLDANEVMHVRTHPSIGGRILEPISAFFDIMPIITDHHERWDGTGYPNGLAGEEIHINARILAVADAYDAMTSFRPYRRGSEDEVAIAEISREAGKQFDPEVVEAFLAVTSRGAENQVARPDLDFFDDAAGGGA